MRPGEAHCRSLGSSPGALFHLRSWSKLRFRVSSLGFGVWSFLGLEFGVLDLGFGVLGLEFGVFWV